MSKLFTLKDWLSLEEASRHLAALIEEPVSTADLLQLGLQGRLTLSVRLVLNGHAKVGRAVAAGEAKRFCIETPPDIFKDTPPGDKAWFVGVEGLQVSEDIVLELSKDISTIYDVWDLSMWGNERILIEEMYQGQTGGPKVELYNLDGPILVQGDTYAQIHYRFDEDTIERLNGRGKPWNDAINWYPADALPEGSVVVIRPSSLNALVGSIIPPASPPLSTRPSGGRPASRLWPTWVAELVCLIHDTGIAAGVGAAGSDELIVAVADRLAVRGLEAPARSTVQETVRAVLKRLREARN